MSVDPFDPLVRVQKAAEGKAAERRKPKVPTPEETRKARARKPSLPTAKVPKAKKKKGKPQRITARTPAIRQQLLSAGYSGEEIDLYFGTQDLSTPDGKLQLNEALRSKYIERAAIFGVSEMEANLTVIKSRGTPGGWRALPPGVKGPPLPVMATEPERQLFYDALIEPYRWDRPQVEALQNKLISAGFLQRGSFHPGYFDGATLMAYKGTLVEAARSEKTAFEILTEYELSKPLMERDFAPSPFVQEDPSAVEMFVEDAWAKATGQGPSEGQRKALVDAFRSYERRAYENKVTAEKYQFGVGVAQEIGGAFPEVPVLTDVDPQARVQEEAREAPEADEFQAIKWGLTLRDLLRGE